MYKKLQLVMLPTNEKAQIIQKENNLLEYYKCSQRLYREYEGRNLYFLSDEEIKEGDWVFHKASNEVIQYPKGGFPNSHSKKIIATTDKSIQALKFQGTPLEDFSKIIKGIKAQPSESFIEYYVSEYNKGNIITEVMVEYEARNDFKDINDALNGNAYKIKVNSDNTINIKPIR